MASTADYDAPRRPAIDLEDASVDELQTGRSTSRSPALDLDEAEAVESLELPGVEGSDEELTAAVVPMMADEFRCSRCFLVHHRSQLAIEAHGELVCRECA